MPTIALSTHKAGHLLRVLGCFRAAGWDFERVPTNGQIARNGQRILLNAKGRALKLRLFVYKVSGSGRSREHERRIEITTTYNSGLKRLADFEDAVLGYNEGTDSYVGVDPRRISFGGETHNASSFFDLEGLGKTKPNRLLIISRQASQDLFPTGIEYHAFFDKTKMAEYLFNYSEIHNGTYEGGGAFSQSGKTSSRTVPLVVPINSAVGEEVILSTEISPNTPAKPDEQLVAALEASDFKHIKKARLTPTQLRQIQRYCEEIGSLGEQYVVDLERKRLERIGHKKAAGKVHRISLTSVAEGFDIISFEDDGATKRFLEVKCTTGKGMVVDMSDNEWQTSKKLKKQYYLVRVIGIKSKPNHFYFRDPANLESAGNITKTPSGWRVTLPANL